MNNINNDQNKEENLMLIFSQKILYDKSKNIKFFTILLAVVNVLLDIVLKSILSYPVHCAISTFIITCFSKYMQSTLNGFNDLASATQELVDRRLFGFEVKSKYLNNHTISELISVAKDLKEKYPQKYLININNNGTDKPNGVKDWYTNIPSNLSINDAILKCQKQNTYWDKCLINHYRKLLKILCFFILVIFLFLYWNQRGYNFVLGIISYFSICEIIINELLMSNKYISNNIEIDSIISTSFSLGVVNTDILENLQSKIFARRKSGFNVPSFIHKLNLIQIHYKYNRDN